MRRLARLAVMVPFAALLHSPTPAVAQVSLGAAEDVAVLAGSAVTCTDSMVTANVAIYPGTAVTQTRCTIPGGRSTRATRSPSRPTMTSCWRTPTSRPGRAARS
jgi:hypothetical protein